ncbi:MAG: secretin N-terminal domain-containing protein [Thermaceae bacterium]
MKKAYILLFLSIAKLLPPALAGTFPDEARFRQAISLKTAEGTFKGNQAFPLDVVLEALARSVGLQPLIYRAFDASLDPAKAQPPLPFVKLDFQGKPFREVWDLLFSTYGSQYNLDYLFLPPDVVVVAPSAVITALVDAPSRGGAAERRPYLLGIPEAAYRQAVQGQGGQVQVTSNVESAKAWVQNDLLPFLSREAGSPNVNWIVVEEGGRLKAILSVLATPEQHARFTDILQRAGIDFRPLPPLKAPEVRVERSYALAHTTFPELLPFLQAQLPGVQISPLPTDSQRAVVVGTEADHAKLAELLKAADLPKTVQRVYTLQHLDYEEVQKRLEALLTKELPTVRLEAVPGNPKALLAQGVEKDLALFAELLKAVDLPLALPEPPKESAVRRIYPLRHADAAQIAPFLAKEVPGIVVQTVPGQNLLTVRGTEAQHAEVQALLAQIDRPKEEGPPIFQRTYQLSNAKAKEVAQILQEAIQAQGEKASRTAKVAADERTNTLIVTGTLEELILVEGLIPKLDQAVPQVNLRVRIQEVQSNLSQALGIKWNTLAGGNVAASILENGLSLIFDATRSLAALNIVATLDALQRQGLSRALRDVNQTVLDNQTARLQSGETFFIRRVVENRVEKVPFDIGVIVEVTPQVTADGQILLNIKAEVSGNVQRNPVDGDVDRFTKQVVTTTLRVRDGQTVVLGGLTSQEKTQSVQGVPLLMDIPLIGELFKQRSNDSTDRELLVVITADILREASR